MTNNKPVLAILAAGMGSRYGGLKQIDPVGPNGELIIDYSLYDAKQAGFSKVVFLIKEEMQEIFEDKIGKRTRNMMDVEYVYQSINDIPEGANVPEGRLKPWGTGHAVYSLRNTIDAPFGVINADDFYGRETYQKLYEFLITAHDQDKYHYCMVGFDLQNTLTESGAVSRGVCEILEDGNLSSVTERLKITKQEGDVVYEEDGNLIKLPSEATASLNVWGFTPSFFGELKRGLTEFLANIEGDPIKREYYLPFAVDHLIKLGKAEVKVLKTKEKWYGVTYKEDKERVREAFFEMAKAGLYPPLK
ncbi:MAG: sugar phosphate nucleotidyltransferase [Clostridiales bacterium]|nr:sugar phosphate nucleotidyltransferase [Clostridiales bacterium]